MMMQAKPNWGYLIGLTVLCGFCTQTLGEALAANGAAYGTLFTSPADVKAEKSNLGLLASLSILGVALGALFGGKLINAYGRKKVIMHCNLFIIIWSALSLISVFYLVLFARFMFGVTVGFLLAAAPKIVIETVPAHLLGHGFGSFANIFTFFFAAIVVGVHLMTSTLMVTKGYAVIYMLPVPFIVVAAIGLN